MLLCNPPGNDRWYVPVSAPATVALVDLLLVPGDDSSRAALQQACQREPGLAVWTVAVAAALDGTRPETTLEAARWLQANGLRGLRGRSKPLDPTTAEDVAPRAADLAAAGVQRAVWAAALAESDGHDPQAAYLAALVADGDSWLQLVPPDDAKIDSQPDAMPSLLNGLVKAEGTEQGVRSAEFVEAAVAILAGQSKPPQGLDGTDRRAAEAAEKARHRWTNRDQGEARRLLAAVDVLERLGRLETGLADRLEREKMEAMAEFAAGAGHELNNPLAVISGRAQLLMRDEPNAGRRRELAVIKGQAKRINEMIADVMLFGRPPRPRLATIDATTVIGELLQRLHPRAEAEDKSIVFQSSRSPLCVEADPVQLAVALAALCDNALDAVAPGGRVTITTAPSTQDYGDRPTHVRISVRDDGPGVPAEIRDRVFDPFYSGRPAGRGLGFGLSKCWRIVTSHGGQIQVDSPPEGGALFTVTLPCVEHQAPDNAATAEQAASVH